jgi:hypothetical protein
MEGARVPAPRRVQVPPAQDPEEQQTPPEEQEGDASADSSTGSSAATEFFEDTGPEFEGKGSPLDEDRAAFTIRPGEQELLDIEWDPNVVKSILEASGSVLHQAAGKGEQDWIFIERELRAIAPPLARILSRYPATAAAAAAGDEFAVIIGLSGYTIRSLKERKAALEAAAVEPALNPTAAAAPAPDPVIPYDRYEPGEDVAA